MNIAITGNLTLKNELLAVISQGNNIKEFELSDVHTLNSFAPNIIIDLDFETEPETRWPLISFCSADYYLLGSVNIELGIFDFGDMSNKVFGICNLPTFLARKVLEYTSPANQNEMPQAVFNALNFENAFRVKDRVGMASPRVICMIINEAYYTVQEGTANRKDIDLGMKLGTAYPMGPFEWADKMGIQRVYDLLLNIFEDTMDERYKICNLLKTEALAQTVSLY